MFTALASFLSARFHQGVWHLRIDDIDVARNSQGAVDSILSTLEAFGLHWDGSVHYQSQNIKHYENYLADLRDQDLTFRCVCSRKSLDDFLADASPPAQGWVYPGFCLDKDIAEEIPHAIRIKTRAVEVSFQDRLQGIICHHCAEQHGDFILKRKDQFFAYPFAVVVDDALEGINHVVRGYDLLEETPKQIYLQQVLGLPTPEYTHVPILVDSQGFKLSKQHLAKAVDRNAPHKILFDLLTLLKQMPPNDLNGASVRELLDWARVNWQVERLAYCKTITTTM